MKKILLLSALIALTVSLSTIGIFQQLNSPFSKTLKIEHVNSTPARSALYTLDDNGQPVSLDFTTIAKNAMDGVVHIKTTGRIAGRSDGQGFQYRDLPDPFRDFFRQFAPDLQNRSPQNDATPPVQIGTGSGVIINSEGYIVTNNHVIADADDIEVSLHDNRTFKAKVIGADPTTDLALLQIKANNLPAIPLVNSDDVKVGEWVLAIGNPFNLNSTVTAGIVSAKARNINLLQTPYAVESFIQTDAAINPGNSGGALVNLDGGLVGINTAIASPTGVYNGYGFAVPSNIVNKVVEDLLKYGVVQRGVLGVMIRSVDGNLAKEKDLNVTTGAYVDTLMVNSAAAIAGIQPGDVIISVGNAGVSSSSQLQELIAQHRPGDKVDVKVNRNGREKTFTVTLNNREGNTSLEAKENRDVLSVLGAELKTLDKKTAQKLEIPGGVLVQKLYAGKLRQNTAMREGFIITKIDGQSIRTKEELIEQLNHKKGGILLEGVYEEIPGVYYYAFGMDS